MIVIIITPLHFDYYQYQICYMLQHIICESVHTMSEEGSLLRRVGARVSRDEAALGRDYWPYILGLGAVGGSVNIAMIVVGELYR